MTKLTIDVVMDNGKGDVIFPLPAKYEVCPRCAGHGKHDHPAFCNGITASEWQEDWDDDSREGYLTGRYDVTCEMCCGNRVVKVVDESRLSSFDREAYAEHLRREAHLEECTRMQEAERRFGA